MIGTRIGAYRVVSQLGAGGMGVVYKALDERLQRYVALKLLPAAVSSDAGRRRRFLQEARAASALNDPHIITIHDIVEHEGKDILVMELIEGRTLRELMVSLVAVDQAVAWVSQIASALVVAHAAGIVHRDLKPGNVMVKDGGLVKVLDFGLAKKTLEAEEATLAPMTNDGDVLGTVEYMSPEQARGAMVDHRSDIFSLGAIFYELLTGRRPFTAPNRLALLQEILHGPIPPIRSLRPEVSESLEALVMQTLERDVRLRYQSMWEFAAALRAFSPPPTEPRSSASSSSPSVSATAAPTRSAAVDAPPARTFLRLSVAAVAAILVLVVGALFSRNASWWAAPTPTSTSPSTSAVTPSLQGTPLELTQQGLELLQRSYRAGNMDRAIASFEAAIARDKTYAPAWAALARAFWRQQFEARADPSWGARAIDAAKQAVALSPYLADGHVSLGLASLESGDRAVARTALEYGVQLDPTNAAAHRGLGSLAQKDNRLSDAEAHYRKAMELAPGDWELLRLMGDIPYQTGRYAEALEWFTKSAQAAPDNAFPFRLMGAASHMLGDYPAAANAFQKSLAIQPTSGGYTNLGTALFFQGLYRDSLQAFERAVELSPNSIVALGNVGDAYRWVPGHTERSTTAYARAIQLLRNELAKDAANLTNRSRLALYLAKSGDAATALSELSRVIGPTLADVNALYRGAVTYEIAGHRAAALATLERALDGGYGLIEIRMDPELAKLRSDPQYQRLVARFERGAKP